jgi:transcriptional regulator with XRE-family HTH domain
MYEEFVRKRIIELQQRKGVSAYKMSKDLGHSRGYIYNISSGKSLPPLKELFAIIEYFEITPLEFFREQNHYPDLVNEVVEGVCGLDEGDIEFLLDVIGRIGFMRGIIKDLSPRAENVQNGKGNDADKGFKTEELVETQV